MIERKYPNGKPSYTVLQGYRIELAEGASIPAAITTIQSAMKPADTERITGWLAEMSVKCAFKQQTDFTGELTLRVYARDLQEYPADVVRQVLRDWPNGSKWWPTWSELREKLEAGVRPRRLMRTMLEHKARKIEEGK